MLLDNLSPDSQSRQTSKNSSSCPRQTSKNSSSGESKLHRQTSKNSSSPESKLHKLAKQFSSWSMGPGTKDSKETGGDNSPDKERKSSIGNMTEQENIKKVMEDKKYQDELAKIESEVVRSPLRRIVESSAFSSIVGAIILVNGVMIGVETDHDFHAMGPDWSAFGTAVDFFFTLAFTVELILKLCVYRTTFFTGEMKKWNIFDFVLVVLSFTETVILPFAVSGSGSDLSQLSVLRLLRLLRVIRLLRLLRVFRQLWLFVCGIMEAVSAVLWGMLLTILVIYMAAIYCTNMMREAASEDQALHDMFGTVGRSMFSLFQVATGDNWADSVVRPVLVHKPYMVIFFMFFIALTQFAFLNVVVAVIVESVLIKAVASDEEKLAKAEAELREVLCNICDVFNDMDIDGDGVLTKNEFISGIKDTAIKSQLHKLDISLQDAEELFDIVDYDRSGVVSLDEFVEGCMKGRGSAKSKDLLSIACDVGRCVDRLGNLEQSLGSDGVLLQRFDQQEQLQAHNRSHDDERLSRVERMLSSIMERMDIPADTAAASHSPRLPSMPTRQSALPVLAKPSPLVQGDSTVTPVTDSLPSARPGPSLEVMSALTNLDQQWMRLRGAILMGPTGHHPNGSVVTALTCLEKCVQAHTQLFEACLAVRV